MKFYRVRNWDELFETCETKKLVHLRWVPVPNKHDGKSFRRISKMKNSCRIFTAWVLILQIASKCAPRGLLQDNGVPLTPEDMSLMTGFDLLLFQEALPVLSNGKVDWLEIMHITDSEQVTYESGEPPAIAGESPVEGKGREGIEGKEIPAVELEDRRELPLNLRTEAFLVVWDEWLKKVNPKMSQAHEMKVSLREQLLFLSKLGEPHAIESIRTSLRNRWKGLFEVKGFLKSQSSMASMPSGADMIKNLQK